MKKIKTLLFPQKGKEKPVIRFYIVIVYTALISGIIFTFIYCLINTGRQNILHSNTVQEQLSWALLDSSITSETVQAFENSKISGSKRNLSEFDNGYEYKNHLVYNEIPELASRAGNIEKTENVRKVADILEQNIENYSSARSEIFSPSSAIIDGLLFVIMLIIPLFIFFRAIIYRVLLYIVFGKAKS